MKDLNGFTHIGIWIQSKKMCTSLTLMVDEDDKLGSEAIEVEDITKFICGRVLTTSNPSKAFFDVAQSWYKDCYEGHSQCGGPMVADTVLPDRIVEVALHGGDPRLVDGCGMTSCYATLSHCWGGSVPMMTLRSNLDQRLAGIPFRDLPKTFQDAITCCRALLIPYLWIDSLCIIQDSASDWEIQSRKMHSIYHGSTLTLAALDAKNSSEGLFLPRTPFVDIYPLTRAFGEGCGQAYVGPPTRVQDTHCVGPTLDYYNDVIQTLQRLFVSITYVKSGPLETRAWAMQELRLSRRVLYFFHGGMMWRCTKAIWHQNGCQETPAKMYHLIDVLMRYEKGYEIVRQLLHSERCPQALDGASNRDADDVSNFDEDDDWDAAEVEADDGKPEIFPNRLINQTQTIKATDEDAGPCCAHPSVATRKLQGDEKVDSTHSIADHEYNKLVQERFLQLSNAPKIQNTWFDLVSDYSDCDLTIFEDKLPALSGIASRIQAITKDQYLAGHWRIDLDQTLFWGVGRVGTSRTKSYRAPTWSWASIDGSVTTEDLVSHDGKRRSTVGSLQVVHATTQNQGENIFGRVTSGEVVVIASTITAHWDSARRGWLCSSRPCVVSDCEISHDVRTSILDRSGRPICYWRYDDVMYGVFPGPVLTVETPRTDVESRRIYEIPDNSLESWDTSPLWEKATYAPENLLLVKGPAVYKTKLNKEESESAVMPDNDVDYFKILVLKQCASGQDVYERVGVGELSDWDEGVATFREITIV